MHTAIIISTVRQHIATAHTVSLRCPRCDRRTDLDLQALVERGLGDESLCTLRSRLRCRDCGTRAEVFRHAPVPPFVPNDPRFAAPRCGSPR